MNTIRIIGIDLAVTAAHKAIVLDSASNQFVTPVMTFHTTSAELDRLLEAARKGAPAGTPLIAVLEATNIAWFMVGVYLLRHGAEVYRVNGRQTGDQRRVHYKHAKSDRIDARVLPRLYTNAPDRLCPLTLAEPTMMELQRACREMNRLSQQISASKNRLLATDHLAWLGLSEVFPQPFDLPARWVRRTWYDPWRVVQAGVEELQQAWQQAEPDPDPKSDWIPAFWEKAMQVKAYYGEPAPLDYEHLQAFLQREQGRLEGLETQKHFLQLKVVRPLYRQLAPERHLESLMGVSQDSAAVYISFIGDVRRFPSIGHFLGWSGMIPYSSQSGEGQAKGLHITQAGPDLVKKTAFLDASVGRLYDPQLAWIYYDQMVNKGKHYLQAICACTTHLLTRIFVVLRDHRPYELRDVDGTPVTKEQARAICQEKYKVSDEVRQRNNHRVRKQRAERRLEERTQRREQNKRSKG